MREPHEVAPPVLAQGGHESVTEEITATELGELRREAIRLRGTASRHVRQSFAITDDGRVLGPVRNWVAPAGEALGRVHASPRLLARLKRSLGHSVRPSLASYLYYGRMDSLALHVDQPVCAAVVLLRLDGSPGPLHVHPELRDRSAQQILELAVASGGHPPGGTLVDLRTGPVLLAGGTVPHHRPPHEEDEELILASLCYSFA
jgi:hypothetical protein